MGESNIRSWTLRGLLRGFEVFSLWLLLTLNSILINLSKYLGEIDLICL